MAIKKVRERVHNGGTTGTEADYDVIHYETSEDLIVGQKQSLVASGYRIMPGDLIMQWGTTEIHLNNQGNKSIEVIFPISFKSSVFSIIASEQDNLTTTLGSYNIACYDATTNKFKIMVRNIFDSQLTGRVRVNWIAFGK